ncbi:MAG: 2-succinyl-5-enolpyruvyl-6-hydroxy-3-cyclohexene-1-carboxylic-acid synthase [Verrucomicrobiota bacterium]
MQNPTLDLRNVNSLWASVLVETLARAGVTRAVVSPGSRSTPLTFAFAAHSEIEAIPVLDERSAAFFALGLAKLRQQPVVLVCTSGTATANYLPAIVEASESGVPLLVLTADRPPEMRACASGQTIDQLKLYGGYVNFFHELGLPAPSLVALRYLRQTVLHALSRTRMPFAGPVHVNIPFRDPLPPIANPAIATAVKDVDWALFFSHIETATPQLASVAEPLLRPDVHGIIVVGPVQPANPDEFVASVAEVGRRLGWPVLSDGLSPVRNHKETVPNLVTTYDAVLRNPAVAERLKPEVVLCIGDWPTSKVLRTWLQASDAETWLISSRPGNRDALHGRTRQVTMEVATLATLLPEALDENGYTKMWLRYEERARTALDAKLEATTHLFEGRVSWMLAKHLPEDTPLYIASSMPVRDMEYFWPPNTRRIQPHVNRGANGIDGTLSTALGVAHAAGRPSVLLTGDLALLHDTNGFLLKAKFGGSLTIILINNRGGGIFEHLPVAQFDPPFEEFFATPQEVDFGRLCSAYEIEHVEVYDWGHFIDYMENLPAHGMRVLELRTDRKRDAALRKTMLAEVAAAAGSS